MMKKNSGTEIAPIEDAVAQSDGPAVVAPATEEQPARGGSFVRLPDGSLVPEEDA